MTRKALVLHTFLFAVFPTLFLYSTNVAQLEISSGWLPVLITLSFSLTALLLLDLLLKNRQRSGAVVSLFLVLFFSCGHVYSALLSSGIGGAFAAEHPGRLEVILFSAYVIILVTGTGLLVRKRGSLDNFTRILNVVAVTMVTISLANVVIYKFKTGAERNAGGSISREVISADRLEETDGPPPDIYFIILDAYANNGTLKEIYNYDNSGFIDDLISKGFYVAEKAVANYCQTSLSLASCFNVTYLDEITEYVDKETRDVGPLRRMIRQCKLFKFLRARGYTIVAFASGSAETEIITADRYITPEFSLDTFQNLLVNTTPVPMITKLSGIPNQFDLHRERILFILSQLPKTKMIKSPKFVFAHIEVPHPPFVSGPNGEKVYEELYKNIPYSDYDGNWLIKKGGLTREEYEKAYRDQIIFINDRIKKVISGLLKGTKDRPVIVMLGDHGPRSRLVWEDPSATYFKECMSILNTFYFPDGDYTALYPDITLVNTFRVILDKYFGTQFGLLEDRSYFSTAREIYKFIDVTDEVLPISGTAERKKKDPSMAAKMNAELLNTLGVEAGNAGDIDRAISLFEASIKADPKYAEAWNNLGYAFFHKGDVVKAEGYFKKAIESDPGHRRAIANLEYVRAMKDTEQP